MANVLSVEYAWRHNEVEKGGGRHGMAYGKFNKVEEERVKSTHRWNHVDDCA